MNDNRNGKTTTKASRATARQCHFCGRPSQDAGPLVEGKGAQAVVYICQDCSVTLWGGYQCGICYSYWQGGRWWYWEPDPRKCRHP